MKREIIETGFWCDLEGMYFTNEDEHRPFDASQSGPVGHFGHPCENDDGVPATHRKVAVVEFEWRKQR